MLAVHRNAGAFRHHAAVGSWLHRIVVNACIDKLRHNRTHDTLALEPDAHPVVDHIPQIDTALVVRRALARLTADQRAAVVAVDMQGYSVADAARLLGVPRAPSRAAPPADAPGWRPHLCTGMARPRAMRRRRDGHWPGELHAAAHGPPGRRSLRMAAAAAGGLAAVARRRGRNCRPGALPRTRVGRRHRRPQASP